MKSLPIAAIAASLFILSAHAGAETLEVGPDKAFARIEEAYEKAADNDSIVVYPMPDGLPYEKVALRVFKKGLTLRAAVQGVELSGKGFDYSGAAPVPRAILQFNEGADNCVVEGFDVSGAHNQTNNGAGIRINGANGIRITRCDIHDNDMGVMSGGDRIGRTGADQRIEHCRIHDNGRISKTNFFHNLYLAGDSAAVNFCEIYNSRRGHNVKSRAHFTLLQHCYIHDSADRELDLVDSAETERPGSDAVLVGNIIVKDPGCIGNMGVINFGQDVGGSRDGTLYLIHNTIITPFSVPVITLSSAPAKAVLIGNLICDNGAGSGLQELIAVSNGADFGNLRGSANVFGRGFPDTGWPNNIFGWGTGSDFVDQMGHDYRPARRFPQGYAPGSLFLPALPPGMEYAGDEPLAWQYKHPAGREERPREEKATAGAYGYRETE